MQLARASLRASAREIQRQAPRIRHAQSKTHDFSVLATVNWDPDRAQFTSSSSNPLLSPGLIQCNRWKKFPSPWVSQNNLQQIRFKRHDRASRKPRPQTQKQRQKYNRKIKIQADEKAKHSAPGTHAGPRRQWRKERIQELLDYGKGDSNELLDPNAADLEYGYEDALLEDLMGNSAHLTSQPTPEPIYWGHKHKQFYNKVANQMDRYREAIEARRSKEKDDHELLDVSSEEGLPSDKSISMVLRSYRDRHGSRTQPIGIVKALQHLLKDLGIPTAAFEERTYTTLLTCCRTPKEVNATSPFDTMEECSRIPLFLT